MCHASLDVDATLATKKDGAAMCVDNLISPDGYYYIGRMLSKAEVVSALCERFGHPAVSLSIEDLEKIIAKNTRPASPITRELVSFSIAGLEFKFVGEWLDVKPLLNVVVEELEKIKEAKSDGYAFVKGMVKNSGKQ